MHFLPIRGKNTATRNINTVFVMGGTHGNERTGIHAIQYLQQHEQAFKQGTVNNIKVIWGNEKAVQRNSRYIQEDLNRCFLYDYDNPHSEESYNAALLKETSYERKRALEIRYEMNALSKPVDFLIDLHTTTSQMENCLIVSDNDPWTDALCGLVIKSVPNTRLYYDPVSRQKDLTSSSLGLNHITIEMGAIQQGVPDHDAVQNTLTLITAIITAVDHLNNQPTQALPQPPSKYTGLPYNIDYPRDSNGFPSAIIHPAFMHKDFQPLKVGQPLFKGFNGKVIYLEENASIPNELITLINQASIVPVFIGEAAYIEKGIAFRTAQYYNPALK